MSSLMKHIHDDYIYMKRARAYDQKKRALLKLKKRKAAIALRNPDEFYLERVKTKKFGVFYKIKRRATKYPKDDLKSILLKKEIKEIDAELEEVNVEIEAKGSELKELRETLYNLQKEYATLENPNQFINDGVLTQE